MTFQEARAILHDKPGTHDSHTIDKAIEAVRYFENNILELEDYETDQLFKVIKFIEYTDLEELGMTEQQLMTNKEIDKMESEHTVYEEKLRRLHHLLIIMENEFTDIRKVYHMAMGDRVQEEDYMLQYMDQFESLLGIAVDTSETERTKSKIR